MNDAVLAGSAFGATPSNTHWNPLWDIAEPSGVIDMSDMMMINMHYGEEYTPRELYMHIICERKLLFYDLLENPQSIPVIIPCLWTWR